MRKKSKAEAFIEFCELSEKNWDFYVVDVNNDETIVCYTPKGFPKPSKEQLAACPEEWHEKHTRGRVVCYQVGCSFCPHKCYEKAGTA